MSIASPTASASRSRATRTSWAGDGPSVRPGPKPWLAAGGDPARSWAESDLSDRIPSMAAVSTTTFDERALEALPDGAASTASQRRRALELFRSMPVPSQETEEWRYTDPSGFGLGFAPPTP